jgi:hypothetical protein
MDCHLRTAFTRRGGYVRGVLPNGGRCGFVTAPSYCLVLLVVNTLLLTTRNFTKRPVFGATC